MPKDKLFLLALAVTLAAAYLTLVINTSFSQQAPKSEIETAVNQANLLYRVKLKSGEDMNSGPCLSDALMPNWVVDIVHNPRQEVDDLEENQCPSYIQGRSLHLVELDKEGNLIRAR